MTASPEIAVQPAVRKPPLPDWTVVQQSAKDLLQSVWEEASPQLVRMVAAMGIGPGRREDVLQDVYLAAWQKAPADAGPVQLRRWLIRVAINRCNLEQRWRRRWQAVWQRLAWRRSEGESSDAMTSQAEERELVRGALARLKPHARSLLVLRYFAELDSTEIGKILEQPDATVRGQLRAARRQLAAELERAGYRHE